MRWFPPSLWAVSFRDPPKVLIGVQMNYPHPIIAREGWPFLAGSLLLAVLASSTGFWSMPFWLIFLFCLQFFRDPARVIAGGPKSIVAPADGRVVVVEEADDPYLNRRALKVSVFMNVFNVHSNRSPVACTVQQKWYNPGHFFNASLDKASLENERCAMHLKTMDGRDVTCVQIAGLVARRILNYVEAGAGLTAGQRYGFIRFGSRVDLYLPLDTKVNVVIGEKVSASSTVLAELA
jgi:phosphatidylserine decarboxylase